MLDIRTIIFLTVIYNVILGLSMILYDLKDKRKRGVNLVGHGLLSIGLGFFCLSMRDYWHQWITIIVANELIILGDVFILRGLNLYIKRAKRGYRTDVVMPILFIILFIYFTYVTPNINNRIIIVALYQIVYFSMMVYVLNRHNRQLIKFESRMISLILLFVIVVNVIRLLWTVYESPIENFMSAGNIHAVSVILYQLIPFNISVGMFWMNNTYIENELKTQAMTDSLTGLYNRSALFKLGKAECHRSQRHNNLLGVVMCDLDLFKNVNDTYGHQAGDEVLLAVASQIKKNIRASDLLSRYGGDEFVILIPDINQNQLFEILNKICKVVSETAVSWEEYKICVTMSFGATLLGEPYDLYQSLSIADQALYQSKSEKGNKVTITN